MRPPRRFPTSTELQEALERARAAIKGDDITKPKKGHLLDSAAAATLRDSRTSKTEGGKRVPSPDLSFVFSTTPSDTRTGAQSSAETEPEVQADPNLPDFSGYEFIPAQGNDILKSDGEPITAAAILPKHLTREVAWVPRETAQRVKRWAEDTKKFEDDCEREIRILESEFQSSSEKWRKDAWGKIKHYGRRAAIFAAWATVSWVAAPVAAVAVAQIGLGAAVWLWVDRDGLQTWRRRDEQRTLSAMLERNKKFRTPLEFSEARSRIMWGYFPLLVACPPLGMYEITSWFWHRVRLEPKRRQIDEKRAQHAQDLQRRHREIEKVIQQERYKTNVKLDSNAIPTRANFARAASSQLGIPLTVWKKRERAELNERGNGGQRDYGLTV